MLVNADHRIRSDPFINSSSFDFIPLSWYTLDMGKTIYTFYELCRHFSSKIEFDNAVRIAKGEAPLDDFVWVIQNKYYLVQELDQYGFICL